MILSAGAVFVEFDFDELANTEKSKYKIAH